MTEQGKNDLTMMERDGIIMTKKEMDKDTVMDNDKSKQQIVWSYILYLMHPLWIE